jgi:ankyrin repeat protein
MVACEYGHTAIVELLIAKGADVNAKGGVRAGLRKRANSERNG